MEKILRYHKQISLFAKWPKPSISTRFCFLFSHQLIEVCTLTNTFLLRSQSVDANSFFIIFTEIIFLKFNYIYLNIYPIVSFFRALFRYQVRTDFPVSAYLFLLAFWSMHILQKPAIAVHMIETMYGRYALILHLINIIAI